MALPRLAATKFARPTLPSRYVARPRLHAVVDAGEFQPLTIVVGVPGAGKSVLLGSWLNERPNLEPIWLSCDERDGDPVALWFALATALRRAWPDRWLEVFDLLDDPDPDLHDVAIAVINDIADLDLPVLLVIDDFHYASAAAPSLTTFVERLPRNCRVVVGSRTEPQLALHRLRGYAQLVEVRDADLRLTADEVAAVMLKFEIDLKASEVELVTDRTDGWTAGVQMAAVALRGQSDPDRLLSALAKTPRAVMDFLGTEVLELQPPEVRDFLLATSVLDVLDPESCAAVTEQDGAADLLRDVEQRNLFLVELDAGVYRYHHLFRDLLRHRLRAEDPDRERVLHQRAAARHATQRDIERAIHHHLAADDDTSAFELLRDGLVEAYFRQDGRALSRISTDIAARPTTAAPTETLELAVALAVGGPTSDAEVWLARAAAESGSVPERDRVRLHFARAVVALRRGEALEMQRASREYLGLSDAADPLVAYVPLGLLLSRLWLGDAAGARRAHHDALGESGVPSMQRVLMTGALSWTACVEGSLAEAEGLAGRALASAASLGLDGHPSTADPLRTCGRLAFERGDFAAAEPLLERSIAISEEVRPSYALLSQLALARVWLADGHIVEAADAVANARRFLPPDSTSPLVGLCVALEARIALDARDLQRADRLTDTLDGGNRAQLLRAKIALARREPEVARVVLKAMRPTTIRERLDVALVGARIAHGDDADDALLREVVTLARSEGFVVVLADDSGELAQDIARLLRCGPVGAFEEAVLARIDRGLPPPRTIEQTSLDALSPREMVVLRYLGSRLTTREIAAELFVSVNTVKTHTKRIYSKLAVSSRGEAITEARRLALL